MKFSRVAISATTVLTQAVLPSAAALRLKDALKSKPFAAPPPQADLALVGERNLAAAEPGPLSFKEQGDEKPQLLRPSSRKLTAWTPVGATIDTEELYFQKIDMTADGMMFVVGKRALGDHNFKHMRFDGQDWVTAIPTIEYGVDYTNQYGQAMYPDISGDGKVIGMRNRYWLPEPVSGVRDHIDVPLAYFFNETSLTATTPARSPGSYVYYGTTIGVYDQCSKMSSNGAAYLVVDERYTPTGYVYFWNGNTHEWDLDHQWDFGSANAGVETCAISGDGRRVMISSNAYRGSQFWQKNDVTDVWEEVASPRYREENNSGDTFASAKISADGSRVIAYVWSLRNDYEEKVYDWNHDNKTLDESPKTFDSGHNLPGSQVFPDSYAISHDGKRIAVRVGMAEFVKVFEEGPTSWDVIFELTTPRNAPPSSWWQPKIEGVGLNCDGTVVAWVEENRIRVYRDPTTPTDTSTCHPSALGGNTYNGLVAPSGGGAGPQAGPWEIQYISLYSNFSSPNEISSDFFIGKDRESEVLLLDKDCESNITGIVISTTKDVTPNSTTFNLLSVHHDLDKSSIANSSIWNGTSNELEVCQVVRLVLPASETGGNGKMIVAEDTRQIKIVLDMTADFNITAGLASATVFNETATTDVSSFVSAYKCNEENFNADTSPLSPNQELSVCVISTGTEVNVKELIDMTASQGDANLPIFADGSPSVSDLTKFRYDNSNNGVVVTTRLPSNIFEFADGNSVTILGQVEMKLADGSTRKLRVLAEAGIEGDEKASYELEIDLQEDDSAVDDGAFAMGSPATAAIALDKAFAFAVALAFAFAA